MKKKSARTTNRVSRSCTSPGREARPGSPSQRRPGPAFARPARWTGPGREPSGPSGGGGDASAWSGEGPVGGSAGGKDTSHPLEGIEEPLVLVLAEAVGHPREVVADRPIAAAVRHARLEGRRELRGVPLVLAEDLGDEPLGLLGHLEDPEVAVELLRQEAGHLSGQFAERGGKPHQVLAMAADLLGG